MFRLRKKRQYISFLMELEKYSYVEALRWLAAKYNVEVEETAVSPEVKQQQLVADSLYILNGFAQQFFSQVLLEEEEGQDIGLSYLEERGSGGISSRNSSLDIVPRVPIVLPRKPLRHNIVRRFYNAADW